MNLTNNAVYRVKNLAFGKYIKGNTATPAQLGHYTLNTNDASFEFIAVETVVTTTTYWKLKTAGNKFWTVPSSGDGAMTLENDLGLTANAFYRQTFSLVDVSLGVVMLVPLSNPNARVQIAGPLPDEGRYLQLFGYQVNASNEQFAIEPVSSTEVVDKPVIRRPVYSHFTKLYFEGVEANAGIQPRLNGLAYGPQRLNSSSAAATIDIDVTNLKKGDVIGTDAFKTGETASVAETVTVEEFAGVVKVKNPDGTSTFNLEILEVVSGTTTDTAQPRRFSPAKIIESGISSLAAAEIARNTAKYTKTKIS